VPYQEHLAIAYYESACRDSVIHALPNVPVERRAATTIAKLKSFAGASARTPG